MNAKEITILEWQDIPQLCNMMFVFKRMYKLEALFETKCGTYSIRVNFHVKSEIENMMDVYDINQECAGDFVITNNVHK